MTVSGTVLSTKPISLSKATSTLSSFVSSDTGASQEFSVYLQRALASFKELKQLHKELKAPRSQRRRSRHRSEAENDDAETVGENPTRSVVVSQEVSHGLELETKPKPKRQRQESNSNGRLENEEPNRPVVDAVERRKEDEKEKKGEFLNFREDRGAIAERGGEGAEKREASDPVEVHDKKKKKKRDNVSNSDENGDHFDKGYGGGKVAEGVGEGVERREAADSAEMHNKKKNKKKGDTVGNSVAVEMHDKKKKKNKEDNVGNSDENAVQIEKGDGEAKIRNEEVKKEEGKKRKSGVLDAMEENLDKKKKRRKS
ncbi:PREDICTED: nucleolar 58 [Prunus dulcis]|uniref:PREDICTED: nucleolar 58 n=1 Tax=Prunus dulcis TaxID=3755 RepID=A0A5E4EYP3_PRUDU|nr:axoneme-associated protein mst101(2) [Prunus dulcis]VVA20813.1 PREDICTED: nucleolar 58 [Prunus dulcis]